MKTAAVYVRISTDKQNESSLADQELHCRAWAKANGYKVAAVYSDAAESGGSLNRPGMNQLRAEAPSAGWAAVLVNDQSRLSRDTEGTLTLIRQLLKTETNVVDCTSGANLSDPETELSTTVNGYAGKAFLRAVGKRTTQALHGRAEKGQWCGGRCFGYSTVRLRPDDEDSPKVATINEAQAVIVRRIFKEAAAGAGLRSISDGLNRDAVPAPYDDPKLGYGKAAGKGWQHTTVRAMLQNPRYRGRFVWNQRGFKKDWDTNKRTVAEVRPESEHVVTERHELAIVPAALWDSVQRVRSARAVNFGVPSLKRKSTPSPLATLVRCGVCHGPMSLSSKVHGGRSLRCSTHRSKGKFGPCKNGRAIQEGRILDFVGDTVRHVLEAKKGDAAFASFEKAMATSPLRTRATREPSLSGLEAAVRKATATVAKQWETLNAVGVTEFGRARYKQAEAHLARCVAALAEAKEATTPTAKDGAWAGWTPELFRAHTRALWEQLDVAITERDPMQLGAFLREHLERVVVTPRESAGAVAWTLTLEVRVPTTQKARGHLEASTDPCAPGSCGGGI